MKDDVFKHSRTVLMSKRKPFKQQGLGNKIMRADLFTDEELEILRKKSLKGCDMSQYCQTLLNCVFKEHFPEFLHDL